MEKRIGSSGLRAMAAEVLSMSCGDTEEIFTIDDPYIIYQNFPYDVGMNYQKPPQYIRSEPKVQNNTPCKCGSGKKFKKCCK